MTYYGKSLDTFESAVSMLVATQGQVPLRHIDCLSGRCFAFHYDVGASFMSSLMPDEDAVAKMNNRLHASFSVVDNIEIDVPFVVRCDNTLGIENLNSRYHNSNGHYIFCIPKKNGEFVIHDPLGYPAMVCHRNEIRRKGQVAITLTKYMEYGAIDYIDVLREGFHTKKRYAWNTADDLPTPRRMMLEYAIRYYLCQVSKVITLLDEVGLLDSPAQQKIRFVFSEMLTIQPEQMGRLQELDTMLWDRMEGLCK